MFSLIKSNLYRPLLLIALSASALSVQAAPPVFGGTLETVTFPEEGSGTLSVGNIASDPDGLASELVFTVSAPTPANIAEVTATGGNGQLFTYTGLPNGFGSFQVILTVTDADGEFASTPLNFEVTNTPDAPELSNPLPDFARVEDQGDLGTLNLNDHFSDPDGDSLVYRIQSQAPDTIVLLTLSGSFITGTTISDANGSTNITICAEEDPATPDGTGEEVCDSFTIDVAAVDDRPVLVGTVETIVLDEDQSAGLPTVDLNALLVDIDTPVLNFDLVSNSPSGLLEVNIGGGILSFQPGADQNGTANLVIRASDDTNFADGEIRIRVEINPTNDAPRVDQGIPDQNLLEDTNASNVDLNNAFEDIDGDQLSYTVSVPNNDVLTAEINGNNIRFTLLPDGNGTVTVTLFASDGIAPPVPTTFQVIVGPTIDAPRLVAPIPDEVLLEDFGSRSISLADVFFDVDGDVLTYEAVILGGANAVVTTTIAGDSLVLTSIENAASPPNAENPTSFQIRVEAREQDTDERLIVQTVFNVTVQEVNDPPLIIDPLPAEFAEDTDGVLMRAATDWFEDVDASFGDFLEYSVTGISGAPVLVPGSVTIDAASGALSFEIVENESGFTDVSVTAEDDDGLTATVSLRVLVNAVNDPPAEVAPLPLQVFAEDVAGQSFSVAGVFKDDDIGFTGDQLTYTLDPIPGLGSFSVSGETVTLILEQHANTGAGTGSVDVTITATDVQGGSNDPDEAAASPPATSTFSLQITPTNDAPFASATQPPLFVFEENSANVTLPLALYFDDFDFSREGDTHSFSISSGDTSPLLNSVTVVGENLVLEASSVNANGAHTVFVIATDQANDTAIDGLSSSPVAIPLSFSRVFAIAVNDDEINRAVGETVTVPAGPANGSILNPGGSSGPVNGYVIDVLANDTLGDDPTIIVSAGADVDLDEDGFYPSASQSEPTITRTREGIDELAPNARVQIVGNQIYYLPKEGFSEPDFFDYTIRDADGDESTARVTISFDNSGNIRPEVNGAPTFAILQGETLVVPAEGGLTSFGFDPDNKPTPAALRIVSYENIPLLSEANLVAQEDGSFIYTPVPDFVGQHTFLIRFGDGDATSLEQALVTITVSPVPAPPGPPPTGEVEFDMNLSDVPLEDAISTEANVLIVMDDSGSMDWDMMTDQDSGVFRVTNGTGGRQNGVNGRGTTYYNIYDLPTNVFNRSAAPVQESIEALDGNGDGAGNDFFQNNQYGFWRLRSAQYSTIYYNPEIEYLPWRGLDRNNTDFGNASPTAAPLDPFDPSGQTIDLTATHSYTSNNVPVFRRIGRGAGNLSNNGVYYPYYYTTDAIGRPAWNAQRDKVVIAAGTNDDGTPRTFEGSLSRLDCAVDDGDPVVCSFAEEMQNFANWFSYYRTREYTAKAALGRSVADAGNLRMGYAVLNDSRDRVPLESLNSSFRVGHKSELLAQVYATNSGGGTPLRRALNRAGRHFECRADDTFGSSGDTAPGSPACPILPFPEGQCQNNFTLLFSDGNWNGNFALDAGIDNNDGDGTTAFDGGVFADGENDTLADVAMYYYERDLHPSLANGVPTNARDTTLAAAGSFLDEDELTHQHMKTYTVGFGVVGSVEITDLPNLGIDDDGEPLIDFTQPFAWGDPFNNTFAKTDDMLHAALNGRGQFLQANNPVLLAQAFQSAFEEFSDGSVSVSAVAFGSTRLRAGTVEYRGFFNLKFNSGDLEAIELLDAVTGLPPAEPLIWSAATQLNGRSPDDRRIATYDRQANDGRPFRFNSLNADQRGILSLLEVDYLRGSQSLEEPTGAFRGRNSILGDIVNSAPKSVGRPQGIRRDRAPFPLDALYSDFVEAQRNRRRVVYVGANDGMLHAFDAGFENQSPIENGTGNELFAYVPNKLIDSAQRFNNDLDQLTSLVYSHKFFVDLTPTIEDVFIRPNGTGSEEWRTLLVGGLRGGGKGYFALDITNPDLLAANETELAKSVLWEFTDADDTYPVTLSGAPLGGSVGAQTDALGEPVKDLGYTYSEARIAMTNVEGSAGPTRKKWAAIFGNGYNSTAGIAKLFVLFVDDGVNGWQNGDFVKVNTGVGTISTDPANPASQDRLAGIPNGLGQPVLIDRNLDGVVDTAYAGDLLGNMWRFDIGDTNTVNWKAVLLFTATQNGNTQTRQSITTTPTITKVPDREGFIVTFGTGSFITEEDGLSTEIQSVYGIWDRFESNPPTANAASKNSLLVEQEITNVVDENRGSDTLRIMSENAVNLFPGTGPSANYGWYFDLDPVRASTTLQGNPNTDSGGLSPPSPQYPGERAIRRIVSRDSALVITTVIPRDANSCFRAPPGAIWFVDALTGGNPGRPVIDLDNDGIVDDGDLVTIDGVDFTAGILFDAGNGDGSLVDPSILLGDGTSDFLVINKSHGEEPDIIAIIKDGNSKTGRLSWWEILGE